MSNKIDEIYRIIEEIIEQKIDTLNISIGRERKRLEKEKKIRKLV